MSLQSWACSSYALAIGSKSYKRIPHLSMSVIVDNLRKQGFQDANEHKNLGVS